MPSMTHWIEQELDLSVATQGRLLETCLLLMAVWTLRALTLRIARRRTEDPRTLYLWRKSTGYTASALTAFIVGLLWFSSFSSLGTFLGLLSAGLAIALRDLVADATAWAVILWRRPFEVGDRIEIGEHAGDVVDMGVLYFSLLEIRNWVDADQSTGRILYLPNAKIFTQTIANFGKGFRFIWNEIPVLITFESDWEKAKKILLSIVESQAGNFDSEARKDLDQLKGRFPISYTKLTPTVYTSVRASGVLLTMRYLVDPRQRRGSEMTVWEAVLREFGQHPDIDFAYPTQRFYQPPESPGNRPES